METNAMTSTQELRTMVETAGGRFKGVQEIPGKGRMYVVFNEPGSDSTALLKIVGLTPAGIETKLGEIRAAFAVAA